MSVTSRSPGTVALETGISLGVVSEAIQGRQGPFRLVSQDGEGVYQVGRDGPGDRRAGWGAGTKILGSWAGKAGSFSNNLIPVITERRPGVSSAGSVEATLVESPVDPVISYQALRKRFVISYWVNAWSPPSSSPVISDTLFPSVAFGDPNPVDPNYLTTDTYSGPQPPERFTAVRDVPNWYKSGTAPDPSEETIERVGPFDGNRFWVAPFSDTFLYRFPENSDLFSPLATQTPFQPLSPPSPPLPPAVLVNPSSDLISRFPYLTQPVSLPVNQVKDAFYKIRNSITLTDADQETLEVYKLTFLRLAGLARCTRVLMQAEGQLCQCVKKEDGLPDQENVYLVLKHPKPLYAFPRGINKVLLGRPKMTTYLGADVFITAALTYRYPAAATVSLCAGNPQVDFTISSVSDFFDENRRMGVLPESLESQQPPFVIQSSLSFPSGYGVSLVEILSSMSSW